MAVRSIAFGFMMLTASTFGVQNEKPLNGPVLLFDELLQNQKPQKLPAFYHTTAELGRMVNAMQGTCKGFTVERVGEDGKVADLTQDPGALSLDVIRIKPEKSGAKSKMKVALVFNEHARELITSEVALWLLQHLCQPTGSASLLRQERGQEQDLLQSNVTNALQEMEFLLVPIANPSSRIKVEEGDYCLRANENGVDLNRDWDEHWMPKAAVSDAPPGSEPFSQPETRILKSLLEDFKPDLFVSVHSGNLGVFVPWAYAKDAPAPARADLSLAEGIAKDFCKCPFGAAAKTVGYPCPGTSLDYVHDKLKARYSFAVEIWISRDEQPKFRSRFDTLDKQWRSWNPSSVVADAESAAAEPSTSLQQKTMTVHAGGRTSLLQGTLNRSVHSHDHRHRGSRFEPNWCLNNFNPTTEDDFKDTRQRWTHALLALANRINKVWTPTA